MKIENAKGRKDENSGYIRLFNNVKLGQLLSKSQATVISNGNELEKIILSKTKNIDDLDEFIDKATLAQIPDGTYVCEKKIVKKSPLTIPRHEPDLLVFVIEGKRVCKVIELKDGDSFDTKKSRGEREQLEEFAIKFGAKIPFVTDYYICCFNQDDKDIIMTGFKNTFTVEHIMTGRELCELLDIDYDEIIKGRKKDAEAILKYFVTEFKNIPEVRIEFEALLKKSLTYL